MIDSPSVLCCRHITMRLTTIATCSHKNFPPRSALKWEDAHGYLGEYPQNAISCFQTCAWVCTLCAILCLQCFILEKMSPIGEQIVSTSDSARFALNTSLKLGHSTMIIWRGLLCLHEDMFVAKKNPFARVNNKRLLFKPN